MRTKPRTPAQQAERIYRLADDSQDKIFDQYWDAKPHERPALEPKLARARGRQERAFKRWICEVRKAHRPTPKRFWPF